MRFKLFNRWEKLLFAVPLLIPSGVFLYRQIPPIMKAGDALDAALYKLAGPNAVNCGRDEGYGVFSDKVYQPYLLKQPFYTRQLQIGTRFDKHVTSGGLVMTPKGQIYLLYAHKPINQPFAVGEVYSVQYIQSLNVRSIGSDRLIEFGSTTGLTPALEQKLLTQGYLSPQEINSCTTEGRSILQADGSMTIIPPEPRTSTPSPTLTGN